jgi:hypothetical protein
VAVQKLENAKMVPFWPGQGGHPVEICQEHLFYTLEYIYETLNPEKRKASIKIESRGRGGKAKIYDDS